jgi:hypothetical protein
VIGDVEEVGRAKVTVPPGVLGGQGSGLDCEYAIDRPVLSHGFFSLDPFEPASHGDGSPEVTHREFRTGSISVQDPFTVGASGASPEQVGQGATVCASIPGPVVGHLGNLPHRRS